jgi:AAA15 family ATPase/GTPase
MATILKSIALENYRGYQSPATPIGNIGNLLMLVGKNDIGKSSVLEALDAFFNTDDIKDSDYCTINHATDISIKCEIDSNIYELKSAKGCLKSYSKGGSPVADREALGLANVHYTLFKADNTKVPGYQNLSVNEFVNKVQSGRRYKAFYKNNLPNKSIKELVRNTLSIAEALIKLEPFFLNQSDTQVYFDDLNINKNFTRLKKHKRSLLTKLRAYTFADPQVESDKVNLFLTLCQTESIYIPTAPGSMPTIKVVPSSAHYSDFGHWFFVPFVDIPTIPIDWNIVNEYAKEEMLPLKPFEEIEDIVKDFKTNPTPIDKRGSGVKRLCAFYKFATEYKASINVMGGKFILAVEEPEISLHPSQQRKFIQQLLDISENDDIQVIATTHSPIIVKEMGSNINSIRVLTQDGVESLTGNRKKSIVHYDSSGKDDGYVSINEINYIAFDEPSIEYHIELFGYMQDMTHNSVSRMDDYFENKPVDPILCLVGNSNDDGFVNASNQLVKKVDCWRWVGNSGGHRDNDLVSSTLPVCVRNNIDHPDSRNDYFKDKVARSIKLMRSVIENDTTTFPIPII